MMYSNKLVAVVKVKGHVLREVDGVVHIPFGSEYTIYLKNLNSRKAVVSIDIDGDDVCDDSQYVIHPNTEVEIEGFLRGNSIANKFKFIEKTKEISDFRGDEPEDGLIKIDFQFESYLNDWTYKEPYWNTGYRGFNDPGNIKYGSSSNCRGIAMGSTPDATGSNDNVNPVYSCNLGGLSSQRATSSVQQINTSNNSFHPIQESDQGITARGSQSGQSFRTATVGILDPQVFSMVFQLKGMSNGQILEHALTVNRKVQCDNCGRKWKSSFTCCGNCGTSLR